MFKITSTRPVTWPGFALLKGENVFPSRKSVPAELWPKLARFRELDVLAFEDAKEGESDAIKLEELTERQLFDMSKADLAELAKANGITLGDEAKKAALLEALVAKAKPLPKTTEEPAENDDKGGKSPVAVDPAQARDAKKQHDALSSSRAHRAADLANK